MDTGLVRIARRSTAAATHLWKRRAWYAEAETPDETPETPPAPAKKSSKNAESGVSQDKVDELVGKARLEGKSTAMADLLKELGFEKTDDLKATIKAKKESDLAQLSEVERLKKEAEEARQEATTAKQKHEAIEQERRLEKRDGKVIEALNELRCKTPKKVLTLLGAEHKAELDAVMKADGSYDEKALKALIDLGKKENPEYFTGSGPGSPSNNNGKTPQGEPDFGKRSTVRF